VIKRISHYLLGFVCTLASMTATAESWTGTIDSNWFNPGNWSGNLVPTLSTPISIDGTTISPDINAAGALGQNILLGISGAGTLNIDSGGQLTNITTTIGSGALSSGTAVISDANTVWNMSGNLTVGGVGAGTLVMSTGGVVNNAIGDIGAQTTSSGTAVLDGTGTQWNNSGDLIIGDQGIGTMVLTDAAIVTNVNGTLGNSTSSATGSVTIDGVGSKWVNSGNLTVANGSSTNADLSISDGGEVDAVNTVVANQAGSGGSVTVANSGSVWNNSTLVIGNAGIGTVTLSDSAAINVTNSSGIHIGSGSVLNIGAADGSAAAAGGQLNATNVFLNNNANIFFNHTDLNNVVNANIAGGGTVTQEGSGTTVLNGTNSYTGGTLVSAGSLQGTSSALQGNITNNSHLIFDQTTAGTFTGNISGSGDLSKNNSGTVILQNTNSYSGTTAITGGTLQIAAENNLGTATTPITFSNGTTLASNRTLAVSQSLQLQRGLLLNADGTLSALGTNTVVTPNTIAGAGNFTTAGTGTVVFNNAMTYTGNTTIAQGTLTTGAANVLTNSPVVAVGSAGTLNLNGKTQAINNLQNNGVISLAPTTTPLTTNNLVVNNSFSGNGSIKMTADLVNRSNDLVTINGTSSGKQALVLNNPQQNVDPTPGTVLKLVQTTDGIAAFSGGTDAGSFEYVVRPGNNSALAPDPHAWYLVRVDLLDGLPLKDALSSTATAAISTFSAEIPLFYSDMQTLTTRMGDLRLGNTTGGWVRAFGNKMQIDNQISQPFNQNLAGLQAGYDKAFEAVWHGHLNVGLFTDYLYAARQFHQNATGAAQSMSVGIYATWLHTAGWYADLVGKFSEVWNNFQATTFSGLPSDANFHVPALGGSLEVGKRITFNTAQHFFIEPQLQLGTVWVASSNYHAGNGLQIHNGDQESLQGRAGVRTGVEYTLNNHKIVEPYLLAAVVQEFNRSNTVTTNTSSYQTQLPQTVKRIGLGIATKLAPKAFLYGEYYYSVGNNFRQPLALNLGLRLSW
jgi:outer membrane autotransporter protein